MNIIPILAAISGESFMWLIIWLVIIAVIYWLVKMLVAKIPMEQNIRTVIEVIMYIGLTILLINALLSLVGKAFITW